MARWKRFRPGPDDTLVVSLAEEELGLLRSLPEQLRDVFEERRRRSRAARLFPRAYLDPTAETEEAEWQALVHPSLLRERLDALELITSRSTARPRRATGGRSTSRPRRCRRGSACSTTPAWCSARGLGVTEEERELDPADPDAGGYALYQWLTWVQGDLVEALL